MRIGDNMYNIIFYEKPNGKSEIWDLLENLRIKSAKRERDDYLARRKDVLAYENLD